MSLRAAFDPVTATDPRAVGVDERVALAIGFVDAARRYWTGVFPHVRRELSHWRERADRIPDPVLNRLALHAQLKRGNLEGAAAFAVFAPHCNRGALVRATVAFQAAYDYLDVLAEQAQPDPVEGARGLHAALLDSLDPALAGASSQPDYYASYPQCADNGYLAELVAACHTALATLPSYAAVAPAARRAAERVVEFQSLNLSRGQGNHEALARWAGMEIPLGTDLRWWESAGAGGSSLAVHALIAAAADRNLQPGEVEAIEHAYFPWIGALHSLLDHLVDRAQDAAVGERNLLDYYASPRDAEDRLRALAERAAAAARALPQGHRHAIILAGMAGYYLSDPAAWTPEARPIAENVRASIGGLLTPTLLVFKARYLTR